MGALDAGVRRHDEAGAIGLVTFPVFLLAAIPAAVALLSWALLGEHVTRRVGAGIACAVGGIVLVSLVRHPGGGAGSWLGNLLLFGAVLCEASYVVIGKQLTPKLSARRISALVNLWGLALMTPFGLWQALGNRAWPS